MGYLVSNAALVSEGGGGTVDTTALEADILTNQNNIALNALRQIVTLSQYEDSVADAFDDETGVDSTPTTAFYDSTNDKYGKDAANLIFLLQSETSDGSTTFTDMSQTGMTLTAVGNAQHDTDQARFGSSSILFDGTGDKIEGTDESAFDFAGDFTIHAWVRPADFTTGSCIVSKCDNTGSQRSWYLFITTGGKVQFYTSTAGTTTDGADLLSTTTLSVDTWYYVTITRSGDDFRLFINGTLEATDTTSHTIYAGTAKLCVGDWDNTGIQPFDGHIEEVQIFDVAEYTSSFTAPTTPASASADNYVLQSNDTTAESTPTKARLVFLLENSGSLTIGTDIKAYVSRDSGTTFTEVTLSDEGAFSSTVDIIACSMTDISSQPSGTSMCWKIETFNNKSNHIHGVWFQWQ